MPEGEEKNGREKGRWTKPKSLYEIAEVAGGFEVTLPGLIDKKREHIVGTSTRTFDTIEDAEAEVERVRESVRIDLELASLEKTFTTSFFRIDEISEGGFKVTLPGLVDSSTGYYVGTTSKEFDSWDEAKEYYLAGVERDETLTEHPILEVQLKDTAISFSDFDSFNPRVAARDKPLPIPKDVEKYLLRERNMVANDASASTYRETTTEKDWERKLFSFVSEYLKAEGAHLLRDIKIEKLDALSPREAIDLAMHIVTELSKYKQSDTAEAQGHTSVVKKSHADESTALQLLQEGRRKKSDPAWEGNGVCRNFASMVKAVFEAIKANQTRFSKLQDTYCLYEGGEGVYAPKRPQRNVERIGAPGHAWNTFVTVSREGAHAAMADATWAQKDLDTGRLSGVDYTLTRMEPYVYALAEEMKGENDAELEQVTHILSYYALKIEKPGQTGGLVTPAEEKRFYLGRVVAILRETGVPKEMPAGLVRAIGQEYESLAPEANIGEIEMLWKIAKEHQQIPFLKILRLYLENKQQDEYHARDVIFIDDGLQKMAYDYLKLTGDTEKFLRESPKFRTRMREVSPLLFPDFAPGEREEDLKELVHLFGGSQHLRQYETQFKYGKPTSEKIRVVFEKIRQALRVMNPEKYDQDAKYLEDYEIVKRYDWLAREMRGK